MPHQILGLGWDEWGSIVAVLTVLDFNKADLTTVENAVEKAYAEAKTTLETVYPQKTEEQEEKADAVTQAKAPANQQKAVEKFNKEA